MRSRDDAGAATRKPVLRKNQKKRGGAIRLPRYAPLHITATANAEAAITQGLHSLGADNHVDAPRKLRCFYSVRIAL